LDYKGGLASRSDQGKYWWELRSCAYYDAFEMTKIIYPDIFQSRSFCLDEDYSYLGNTCYMIPEGDRYLLSILNSTVFDWFYGNTSTLLQGGFMRAFSDYMRHVPIPEVTAEVKSIIMMLADNLLLLSSQPRTPQRAVSIAFFESVLDALVYELYLPDELHAAGYFPYQVISAAAWPEWTGNAEQDVKALERVFQNWYDPTHPVRQLTHFLDSVPEVRIIAGLDERSGNAGAEA